MGELGARLAPLGGRPRGRRLVCHVAPEKHLVADQTALFRIRKVLGELAEALVHQQPDRTARHEALEHCLDKLPEKSRQLLALRYEDDAPMEHVAEAIESSAGAVRVMLFRIRNLLADCVNNELSKTTL
jgi:RNA polymerase sigma-70 factor (ECF subfamily)